MNLKPTDQIRAELTLTNPDLRYVAHMLADEIDRLDHRLGDAPPDPEPIRAPEAEVSRTRKGKR